MYFSSALKSLSNKKGDIPKYIFKSRISEDGGAIHRLRMAFWNRIRKRCNNRQRIHTTKRRFLKRLWIWVFVWLLIHMRNKIINRIRKSAKKDKSSNNNHPLHYKSLNSFIFLYACLFTIIMPIVKTIIKKITVIDIKNFAFS